MRSFDASAGSGPLDPAVRRAMALVAAVFFVKASLLGLFVTPLWDVPDETGHYALIEDIVSGRGLPLMGRSVIPDRLYESWMGKPAPSPPMPNWTAQHPPLYHLAAAPLLAGARALTDDPGRQCRDGLFQILLQVFFAHRNGRAEIRERVAERDHLAPEPLRKLANAQLGEINLGGHSVLLSF